MPTRRKTRFGLGARGVSQGDGSDNFKVAYPCQEGDVPTFIIASLRTISFGAASQNGGGRLLVYIRKNVDQDLENVLPANGLATGNTQTDAIPSGELVLDIDVGVTQGGGSPHYIPIEGLVMQDGEALVAEGSGLTDSGGGNNAGVWGITIMGKRKDQRKQLTR